MKPNVKKLLLYLAVPLAVGGLATLISGGMSGFSDLNQPPLSPPGWVFPVVWSILYLLMGYAAYRVSEASGDSKQALLFYGLQLLVNFLWPIVFFRFDVSTDTFNICDVDTAYRCFYFFFYRN